MAMVAIDHQAPHTHQLPPWLIHQQQQQQHASALPAAPAYPQIRSPTPEPPLPRRNETELTREMLKSVLTHMSTLVPERFDNRPVRLVVHGGACMLLHPGLYKLSLEQRQLAFASPPFPLPPPPPPLPAQHPGQHPDPLPHRTRTRDVDFVKRNFAEEWYAAYGIPDAVQRLDDCIRATARKFDLGADWMNSDADVALPMAFDSQTGKTYDPIYTASVQPNNVQLHTVFTSPNKMLTLVSVTPFWAVALKLVRYTRYDPGDISLILRNGTMMSNIRWTPDLLQSWITNQCWPMGYDQYDPTKIKEMRARIVHAVQMVSAWETLSMQQQQQQQQQLQHTSTNAGGTTMPVPWTVAQQHLQQHHHHLAHRSTPSPMFFSSSAQAPTTMPFPMSQIPGAPHANANANPNPNPNPNLNPNPSLSWMDAPPDAHRAAAEPRRRARSRSLTPPELDGSWVVVPHERERGRSRKDSAARRGAWLSHRDARAQAPFIPRSHYPHPHPHPPHFQLPPYPRDVVIPDLLSDSDDDGAGAGAGGGVGVGAGNGEARRARRHREKRRDRARRRDRRSKWFFGRAPSGDSDTESDVNANPANEDKDKDTDDDDRDDAEGGAGSSLIQPPPYYGSSPWLRSDVRSYSSPREMQIYARPGGVDAGDARARRLSVSASPPDGTANSRRRHRPPSLDLSAMTQLERLADILERR